MDDYSEVADNNYDEIDDINDGEGGHLIEGKESPMSVEQTGTSCTCGTLQPPADRNFHPHTTVY